MFLGWPVLGELGLLNGDGVRIFGSNLVQDIPSFTGPLGGSGQGRVN